MPPRRKQASTSTPTGEDGAIWKDLHARLVELASVQTRSLPVVEEAKAALSASSDDVDIFTRRIESALEAMRKETDEEEALLDKCLEKLKLLMALRENSSDASQTGRQNKRRRMDTSPAPSVGEASSRRSSPLASSTLAATASRDHAPLSVTLKASVGAGSSRAGSRSATPAPLTPATGGVAPDGSRSASQVKGGPQRGRKPIKNNLAMPLQPDRLVAFRRPKKGDGKDEEWILAKIVKCIGGDKNRYEVQDVDPPEDGGAPPSFNTTWKSIIPLPIAGQPDTLLEPTLAVGAEVLALYPDTTSFYRGKVKSGPSAQGRKYKISFYDDDENGPIQVPMEQVLPYPLPV